MPNQAPIDTRALTAQELAGFQHLRLSGAPNVKCFTCHGSQTGVQMTNTGGFVNAMDAMLTDGRRRSNNFPSPPGATGRAVGSDPVKSPTLRNLALKPIFAHNGFFSSLDDLVAFYNREGPNNPSIFFTTGSGAQGRLTDAEKSDVLAFFAALTDPRLVPSAPGARLGPPFDRPDLYSERVPFESNEPATHPGTPPPGTLAAPDVIVNAPALAEGAHWKIGVRDAPAGATAILGVTPQPLRPPSQGPYYLVGPGLRHLVTSTDDEGFATFHLPPADTALVGTVFRTQWRVYPPGSTVPAYSNAGEVALLP